MVLERVKAAFSHFPDGQARQQDMQALSKALEVPLYWKDALYRKCVKHKENKDYITFSEFRSMWLSIAEHNHDEASKFIALLSEKSKSHLVFQDFVPFVQDVVDSHPGLKFLRDATEFHGRYVTTVICRIFYSSSKPWTPKFTVEQLRKSNLLQTIRLLEEEDDINQITDYFSYEHFYVIYCKFWELDTDHDLRISPSDLRRHNDFAISSKIIDRIFSGAVTRGPELKNNQMTYPGFVWFLLAEEDKRHPTSIEYWFRCMDLDGDGSLSFHELEYFYQEQVQRLNSKGIDAIPFVDILCQLLDIVQPQFENRVTLSDLKRCKMASIFFDTFINVEKYLDMEQRDGIGAYKCELEDGLSDWERYAAEEYEYLVAEENMVDQGDPNMIFDDDEVLSSIEQHNFVGEKGSSSMSTKALDLAGDATQTHNHINGASNEFLKLRT